MFQENLKTMSYHLRPNLINFGGKTHSQNNEDGIIAAIFEDIKPQSRYFVEFGIGPNYLDPDYVNGLEGNCVLLQKQGWNGLFMDGGVHPAEYGISQEIITSMNFNSLLRKYNVPTDVDVISIDVDSQDFYIWMSCYYRPSMFILEVNPNFTTIDQARTVAYDLNQRWDLTKYYGASLGAMVKLGRDKGYKLVCNNGCNAFFVRDDLISNPQDFDERAMNVFVDQHSPDPWRRLWVDV
jgi:hypothetical protein